MSAPEPRRKRIECEDIGDITVVVFCDKKILDEQVIRMIDEALCRLIDEAGKRKILINYESIQIQPSAFFSTLITLHRKLEAEGGRLVLCSVPKDVLDPMKIMAIDQILCVKANLQEGLRAFC